MKNWKALIAGFLVLSLIPAIPKTVNYAEEYSEEQEAEESLPDSYYYAIESNEIEGWPQGPQIESASATVMDMDTSVFLYSKNATATMYPASTTKIMTALLLVENCNLDDEITFSEIVYNLEEGSSHLGIQPGETLTLRDAAYGLMLASANDICNGVAEYMSGSISGFAELMNERARELGCVNTHFANPHGLYQEDHYTCAYDMALIAKAAYENPVFREIVTTREYTIPATNLTDEERSFLNHHKMMQSGSDYYQEWCTGGKTGYTEACLNTLVTFAERDGRQLVSVVFRVNGADKAYNESTEILRYGLDNFKTKATSFRNTDKTFYDAMGLRYLGQASEFQSPVWKEKPVKRGSIGVTVPSYVSSEELTFDSQKARGRTILSYYYNDYSVGYSEGDFRKIYVPAQMVFERKTDTVTAAVLPEENSQPVTNEKQISVFENLSAQANDLFYGIIDTINEYTYGHVMAVLIAGIIVLIIIIILIIILIFRCSSESRIKRRRKQEEKIRKKREEEIERMTTAEIEAELREVMERERVKREQEELARARAEEEALEARIMEEKAHETERMLDELEKERQERMASKK